MRSLSSSLLAAPLALLLPVPLKIAVDSVIGSQPPPPVLDALLPGAATESDTALLVTVGLLFVAIAFLYQLLQLATLLLGTHTGERLLMVFRCQPVPARPTPLALVSRSPRYR